MNPCPKCGETKWIGLKQFAPLNQDCTFQAYCGLCKFESTECNSPELAEEVWNLDPMGKFKQLSLLA